MNKEYEVLCASIGIVKYSENNSLKRTNVHVTTAENILQTKYFSLLKLIQFGK